MCRGRYLANTRNLGVKRAAILHRPADGDRLPLVQRRVIVRVRHFDDELVVTAGVDPGAHMITQIDQFLNLVQKLRVNFGQLLDGLEGYAQLERIINMEKTIPAWILKAVQDCLLVF